MSSLDTKLIFVRDFLTITGIPEQDTIISGLAASEKRQGERRGWDKPPQLWKLHLRTPEQTDLSVVPPELWQGGSDNPADDLTSLASQAPEPPATWRHLDHRDIGSFTAMALMTEGWAVSGDDLTEQDRDAISRGTRVGDYHPQRYEARTVTAIDINGIHYEVYRRRGREPEYTVQPYQAITGNLPRALRRMVWGALINGPLGGTLDT